MASLYANNALVRRITDTIPETALAAGFHIDGIDDEQFLDWFLVNKADELGLYWFSTGSIMYESWKAYKELNDGRSN